MNGFREPDSAIAHGIISSAVQQLPSSSSSSSGGTGTSTRCNGTVPVPAGATCCLIENGKRCGRPAISHVLSKRIQKNIQQKRLKIVQDPEAVHSNICFHHRQQLVTPSRPDAKKKQTDAAEERSKSAVSTRAPQVRLDQLSANTLRRFKKFFNLQTRPGMPKTQLAEMVQSMFESIPVDEKEIITYFIYTVKTKKNKLDLVKANGATGDD